MIQKDKKYRGFNEIYFVLYLTAIILLLPEGKKFVDDYIVSDQTNAYIKSEKSSLNVRLKIQDGKSVILSADTVNVIYPVGKIDSVKYNFKLISNNVSNVIYNSSKKIVKNAFQIIENDEGLARFEWFPQNIKTLNKNFEVLVEGEVYSLGKKDPNISTLRFAINTFFIDEMEIAANNTSNNNDLTNNNEENNPNNLITQEPQVIQVRDVLSDISFFPDNPVSAIALTRWKATVRVFGIDLTKDLKNIPKIIADEKHNIKIEEIDSKAIYLSGKTSADESYKVKVEIERSADNRLASTEFTVKPLMIQFPDYPKVMYPNKSYTFKPNLPNNSSVNYSAKLFYKNEVIAQSENGQEFEYIPQNSDTTKILKVNRYIDGKLHDSKDGIRIIAPPAPEITKKTYSEGIITITTKSYGKLTNDLNNVVSKLVLSRNNIKYQDLTGSTQYLDNYTIQVFRINVESIDNSIEVTAVDERGVYSKPEKITF